MILATYLVRTMAKDGSKKQQGMVCWVGTAVSMFVKRKTLGHSRQRNNSLNTNSAAIHRSVLVWNSYILFFFSWHCRPTRVMAASFWRFLDHTRRRITVGRSPLGGWSARRRDLYPPKIGTISQTSHPLMHVNKIWISRTLKQPCLHPKLKTNPQNSLVSNYIVPNCDSYVIRSAEIGHLNITL
jgi:hypothetical protein